MTEAFNTILERLMSNLETPAPQNDVEPVPPKSIKTTSGAMMYLYGGKYYDDSATKPFGNANRNSRDAYKRDWQAWARKRIESLTKANEALAETNGKYVQSLKDIEWNLQGKDTSRCPDWFLGLLTSLHMMALIGKAESQHADDSQKVDG